MFDASFSGTRFESQRQRLLFGALVLAAVAVISAPIVASQRAPSDRAVGASDQQLLLKKYCLACHTEAMKARGVVPIAFDKLDLSDVAPAAETWEKIVRKLKSGVMPPPGRRRPSDVELAQFLSVVESHLDQAAARHVNPGRTEPFHRLNRAEYQNAIRDLVGLDVNVATLLPPDDASYGFDNIAGVLKVSPTLMERYLAAAQKVSRLAVGATPPIPNVDYYRLADDLPQDDHIEGLPVGTRGGIAIPYAFPMDADYVVRVRLARDLNESVPQYPEAQNLEISIDGGRVHLFTLPGVTRAGRPPAPEAEADGESGQSGVGSGETAVTQSEVARPSAATPTASATKPAQNPLARLAAEREARNHADDNWDVRVHVQAGQRLVTVAFLKLDSALAETERLPFMRPFPGGVNTPETRLGAYLRSVEIVGPYAPSGAGHSASRERVFVCEPSASMLELTCARTILARLAREAYRRPVGTADLVPLLAMYKEGRAHANFDAGIERALRALVVSPEFLFRIEHEPAHIAPNTPYKVSDLELASRLSFFLWSSIPDEHLLNLAIRGKLQDRNVLIGEVRRMIADPRSHAFIENFAGQWLYLRNLPSTGPVATTFPNFDDSLRQDFRQETELFVDSIVKEDRSALDFLAANYTYLNERLARHYGVPNVSGSRFRRVTFGDGSWRGGLLGQGSILTVTSQPDRTSPVVRGKWILENLLGTPPPGPPPNVPALKATNATGAVLSMRDRMVQHRANPACAGCHALMDPLGLSLENLDAVGQPRVLGESEQPIDASGALPDGTKFTGPDGLRQALLKNPDPFVTTLTEKLLTYAVGRGLEYYDEPTIRSIVHTAAADNYRFSTLVLGVVQSIPFQMRRSHS